MRFTVRTPLLVAFFLFAAGGAGAQGTTSLTAAISTLCGSGTLTDELAAKCNAAKVIALDHALQTSASGVAGLDASSSAQTSLSATAAIKAQVELLNTILKTDSATLAQIRPTTVTVPDMEAEALAAFSTGMRAAALGAAADITKTFVAAASSKAFCPNTSSGAKRNPALVLLNQDIGDLRRNYFQAKDATKIVREQVEKFSALLDYFEDPAITAKKAAGKPAEVAETGPSLKSFTTVVGGAGLLLDLFGKGAALAASFRPAISSNSATITGEIHAVAQTSLVSALANAGSPVVYSETLLAVDPDYGQDSLRYELEQMRGDITTLRAKALKIANFDYVAAAGRAALDIRSTDDNGKKLTEAQLADERKRERDRLVALGTAKQGQLTKTLAELTVLTKAGDDLNTMIFTGIPAKDALAASQPLITGFDKWEAMQLAGRCVFALTTKATSAKVDKYVKQSAFGSAKYHFKVTGAMPWLLTSERGEVLSAGVMTTSAEWDQFGPKK